MRDDVITNAILEQVTNRLCHIYFIYHVNTGIFLHLSPAFERVWEIANKEAQKHPASLLAYVHAEDEGFLHQQYQTLLREKNEISIQFRIGLPNLVTKWISLSAFVLKEQEEIYVSGYAEDITKQKAYMENILKFNAKKDSTLEILSHDLAAPFRNIQGLATALEEQIQEGNPDLGQIIGFIKQDAQRGTDMIRAFVDDEFLESSQVVLHKERVDIVSKFSVMLDNYKSRKTFVAKEFLLTAPPEPVFLDVDEMKFMQVMNNLISNAIKFTPDNGLIAIAVADKEDNIIIMVTDNGIGIPKNLQPFLFDKFTKARRPGIRGESSVGLGMSIIKTIVQLHQGQIWFESRENEGSTFFIEVPKE
jgi:two-component system, OmpR family, sensor histidine kinase VicK